MGGREWLDVSETGEKVRGHLVDRDKKVMNRFGEVGMWLEGGTEKHMVTSMSVILYRFLEFLSKKRSMQYANCLQGFFCLYTGFKY